MDYSKTILVTSGCSFSQTITKRHQNWPRFLEKEINPKQFISKGLGSQGNGLISRSIIYEVHELLSQGIDSNDILVGIMWSGPNRSEYYWDKEERGGEWRSKYHDGWMTNPANFNPNDRNGGWIITNPWWDSTKTYYKYFHDDTYGQILTLEHILRTQWFLEKHNIKYFMMNYMNETFEYINKDACLHLRDQIDWTKFISTQGCYEWCLLTNPDYLDDTSHPSAEGSENYTKEIIIPYLEKINAKN